jgi:hypothetical protein
MGSTYSNVTLVTQDAAAVAAEMTRVDEAGYILTDRRCVIVTLRDPNGVPRLRDATAHLSKYLKCTAFGVSVFDDDVLNYEVAVEGWIADTHVSGPDYMFEGGEKPPAGDARRLVQIFRSKATPEELHPLLDASPPVDVADPLIWTLASRRHHALVEKLGLPTSAVGFGYDYVANSDLPEGVLRQSLMSVGIVN